VWDELNGEVWHLAGCRTKNGRPRDIPLSSQVVEVVGSLPRVSEHLFINTSSASLRRGKAKLDAACGVEGWTIHDLRRTMCSGMARLGVSIHVIEKCVNHVSGTLSGVAGIYNRYSYEAEKRAAMQLWGDHIEGLVK
jgi:integrase